MRLTEYDIAGLEKVKGLIEQEYKTHYTTDFLAGVALMSRSKITRAYRYYYGMALFEHLQCYRMLMAKQLLAVSSMSIKVVANRCGFQYPCNFATAFKKKFGMSPNQYRQL